MADNPYKTLGIEKTASQDDIRKAYRKLAKELHPDLNPGDTSAEDRFKRVSAAFAILGDKEKRARYDRGEIDATGQERPQQRYYREYAGDDGFRYRSTSAFEDLDISDLFGRARSRWRTRPGAGEGMAMRGQDARYRLDVDFLEAVQGATKRITLPDGDTLDLTVPAGVRDGQVLRLKGKGGPGIGAGPAGDALVEIGVRPHPVFARDGDDILIELPIGIHEAVQGGKVEVPTIAGRVSMTVPKGASSGQMLRLKGKGVRRGGTVGDQLVTLKVVLPDRIDGELEDFMKDWQTRHGYDPRRRLREQA